MPAELLSKRVERLEKTVAGLETLPLEVAKLGERMGAGETQIAQLRVEMHGEFSAVHSETQAGLSTLRGEMEAGLAAMRGEMESGFANVKAELGRQIRESAEETRRHSQVLFEEVLGRIATLGEGRTPPSTLKTRRPPRKG